MTLLIQAVLIKARTITSPQKMSSIRAFRSDVWCWRRAGFTCCRHLAEALNSYTNKLNKHWMTQNPKVFHSKWKKKWKENQFKGINCNRMSLLWNVISSVNLNNNQIVDPYLPTCVYFAFQVHILTSSLVQFVTPKFVKRLWCLVNFTNWAKVLKSNSER